jgi:hypothetical protein
MSEAMQKLGNIHPLAELLRGFALDFLSCHNAAAAQRIMTPDYRLQISGVVFDGRDSQYLPATSAQLQQFPGLCVSVHDVLLGENAVAMRFTEHGASVRDGGRLASWRGVTLFRTDGERLQRGWAEEDYLARKRQLATGVFDPVEPPHPAPWDQQPQAAEPGVEDAAAAWIRDTHAMSDHPFESRPQAPEPAASTLISVHETQIEALFGAGERVAFHATHHGVYAGGFADIPDALRGTPVSLPVAGLLGLNAGQVVEGRIFADRLGLYRTLRALIRPQHST